MAWGEALSRASPIVTCIYFPYHVDTESLFTNVNILLVKDYIRHIHLYILFSKNRFSSQNDRL
jgi:hypothetical protein